MLQKSSIFVPLLLNEFTENQNPIGYSNLEQVYFNEKNPISLTIAISVN